MQKSFGQPRQMFDDKRIGDRDFPRRREYQNHYENRDYIKRDSRQPRDRYDVGYDRRGRDDFRRGSYMYNDRRRDEMDHRNNSRDPVEGRERSFPNREHFDEFSRDQRNTHEQRNFRPRMYVPRNANNEMPPEEFQTRPFRSSARYSQSRSMSPRQDFNSSKPYYGGSKPR